MHIVSVVTLSVGEATSRTSAELCSIAILRCGRSCPGILNFQGKWHSQTHKGPTIKSAPYRACMSRKLSTPFRFTMSMTHGQAGASLTGSRRNIDPSLRLVFGSTNTKKSFVLVTAQDPDPRTQTRSAIERSQLDAPRRSRRSWLRSYVHTDEGASRSAPRRYSWTAKISWLVIGP